MYSLIIANLLL